MRNLTIRLVLIMSFFGGWSIPCQTQDLPYMNMTDLTYRIPIPVTVNATGLFYLAEEERADYLEYMEAYQSLKEQFEETMEEMEAEYHGSNGDQKIWNAEALVELVLQYEILFQALKKAYMSNFKGDQNIEVLYNYSMMNGSMYSNGYADLVLSGRMLAAPADTIELPGEISGAVVGETSFSIDIAVINTHAEGNNQFNDTVKGLLYDLVYNCRQKIFVTSGTSSIHGEIPMFMYLDGEFTTNNNITTGSAVFAGPFVVVTSTQDGSSINTDGYLYDPELNFYHVSSSNNPVDNVQYYLYYKLAYVDTNLELIPFQELKEKFFGYYVSSLHSENLDKLGTTSDLGRLVEITQGTLDNLGDALGWGQLIGIRGMIYVQQKLVFKMPESLFDTWFGLAFNAKDLKILDDIASAGTNVHMVSMLLMRIQNAIKFMYEGETMVSSQVLYSLELFPRSNYYDDIFIDYFYPAESIECDKLKDDIITAEEYHRWVLQVYNSTIMLCKSHVPNLIVSTSCQ
ncbi:MAG: hypothetical protein GY790_13020 [Bacteroidetes bacterium]|nr:hypothetical protein [Bacteroidota bacterium]